MEPLRLGLIGVGGMGASHLKMAREVDAEVRYTALCDVNEALVAAKAAELGLPAFTDYRALIESKLVEAVLIATPHPFHAPVAIYAAEHGVHVLTEKPIAVTVAEADAMREAAYAHGVLLTVMFQERTEPEYRTARRLIESGALGRLYRSVLIASHWFRTQPYYDSGTWRGTWSGEGGGVLMNQAPHSLDLFIWLGGMPQGVTAQAFTRAQRIEVDDTVSALLDYGDGHSGYLYTTTAQYPGEMRMELSGENGQLVIANDRVRFFRLTRPLTEGIRETPIFKMPAGAWEEIPLDTDARRGHSEVLRRFAHAVREGTAPVASGDDGVRALELANAILLSGYTHQSVTLPLDRLAYDAFLAAKRRGE